MNQFAPLLCTFTYLYCDAMRDMYFENTYVFNNNTHRIGLQAGISIVGGARNIVFAGKTETAGNTHGVWIISGAAKSNIVFENLHSHNNAVSGSRIEASTTNITGLRFKNTELYDNGQTGMLTYSNATLELSLENVRMYDTQATPTQTQSLVVNNDTGKRTVIHEWNNQLMNATPITFVGDSSGVVRGSGNQMPAPSGLTANASASGGSLADGAYYFKIVASDGTGTTLASAEATATVSGGAGAGSIALSWTAVQGAVSYRVYKGTATNAQDRYQSTVNSSYSYTTDTGATTVTTTVSGIPAVSSAFVTRVSPTSSQFLGGTLNI